MKRVPNIHVVKRKNVPFGAMGYHKPNTNDIYIARNENTERVKQHELYHFYKNHADKPRSVESFIDHEVEAELYAQKKTGITPISGRINAWINEIYELYKLNNGDAIILIGKRFKHYGVPNSWMISYRKVVSDIYTAMRKTKRF